MGLFGMLAGCSVDSTRPGEDVQVYYDLKGLVRRQVTLLDSIGPTVSKAAEINSQHERVTFKPDSAEWAAELDPLLRLDLNEPHLTDLYDIEVQGNGLQYKSRNPHETRVDLLRIVQSPETDILEAVYATIGDANPLFSMHRNIYFVFSLKAGHPALTSYSISGWQKMLLLDTNHISVESSIDYRPR